MKSFIWTLKVVLAATVFIYIQAEVALNLVLVASTGCRLSFHFVKVKQCRITKENLPSNVEVN